MCGGLPHPKKILLQDKIFKLPKTYQNTIKLLGRVFLYEYREQSADFQKQSADFQKQLSFGLVLFWGLWKTHSCMLIPNCTRNHTITYTYIK